VTSALAEGGRLDIGRLAGASVLGTVPHQHSYGLESLVMLSLQHGLAPHAERLFYPADIRAHIAAARRPTVLVTTPVHLRVLLTEPETPPPVDLVLCATAPLATHLAREAEARFAGALYEIYGCSEAGQVAARRTAVTEEWRCLDGISLRKDQSGIWAAGVPIATETVLPDVIELRDATHFLLHGRIADMVNVAGKRTSLVHLNYHLNAIDGVTDGAFALADSAGEDAVGRLAAFVVAPGRTAGYILAALRERIDVAFLPRPLCLVPALPRNALGKLPHAEIHRLIAEATRPADASSAGQARDRSHTRLNHGAPASLQRHDPVEAGHQPEQTGESGSGGTDGPVAPDHDVLSTSPPHMPADFGRYRAGTHAQPPASRAVSPVPHPSNRTATLRFPLDHPAAAGHFPSNPIIPGAVLLSDILAAIVPNAAAREIRSAKFHHPVRPGDTLTINWTVAENGDVRFSASVEGSSRPAVSGVLRSPFP
jgi:hypothetical protein